MSQAEVIIGGFFGIAVTILLVWVRATTQNANERTIIERRRADVFELMSRQAIHALEIAADQKRKATGIPNPPRVAPVQPEHHSDVTQQQQDVADLGTLRARYAAAICVLGIPEEQLTYERGVRRYDA